MTRKQVERILDWRGYKGPAAQGSITRVYERCGTDYADLGVIYRHWSNAWRATGPMRIGG